MPTLKNDIQVKTVRLLQNQHPSAIAHLYDCYGNALYGIVMRIVHCQDLAQQVTQDTFLKAWHNGPNYDENKGCLFTWLLNIARNTAIDVTRSARYHKSAKTDSIDCVLHMPGRETINHDTLDLKDLVERMEEKYKVLIELVYFSGYTQDEAAELTGMPIGTVKTRLRYAISSLQRAYIADHALIADRA